MATSIDSSKCLPSSVNGKPHVKTVQITKGLFTWGWGTPDR